jgi:hypothetical protein
LFRQRTSGLSCTYSLFYCQWLHIETCSQFWFRVVCSPYDNVCDKEGVTPTRDFSREFQNARVLWHPETELPYLRNITVEQEEPVYYCPQGFRDQGGFNFPPMVSDQPKGYKWMTESQETLVRLYYWTVIVAVVGFLTASFLSTVVHFLISFFRSNYEPSGASQRIDFSCNPEIVAYVPHVKLRSYPFPFLAANVDDLCETLVGFTDNTGKPLDYHNMMFDIPFPGLHRKKKEFRGAGASDGSPGNTDALAPPPSDEKLPAAPTDGVVFGVVKHYPPSWWTKKCT